MAQELAKGWAKKKSRHVRTYRNRFLVLYMDADGLPMLATRKDAHAKKETEKISLVGATAMRLPDPLDKHDDDVLRNHHRFMLSVANGRSFCFATETPDAALGWVRLLSMVAAEAALRLGEIHTAAPPPIDNDDQYSSSRTPARALGVNAFAIDQSPALASLASGFARAAAAAGHTPSTPPSSAPPTPSAPPAAPAVGDELEPPSVSAPPPPHRAVSASSESQPSSAYAASAFWRRPVSAVDAAEKSGAVRTAPTARRRDDSSLSETTPTRSRQASSASVLAREKEELQRYIVHLHEQLDEVAASELHGRLELVEAREEEIGLEIAELRAALDSPDDDGGGDECDSAGSSERGGAADALSAELAELEHEASALRLEAHFLRDQAHQIEARQVAGEAHEYVPFEARQSESEARQSESIRASDRVSDRESELDELS